MNVWKAAALVAVGIGLGAGGMAAAQAMLPAPTEAPKGGQRVRIDLGKAFPQMEGYELVLSRLTVVPGAGIPPHSHNEFPEVANIASGVLSDQRNGGPPHTYGPGSTLINDQGTTHTIINLGKEPVVFYAAHVSKPQSHVKLVK
jgi:quercetin dioxygenase-like cupin family protein